MTLSRRRFLFNTAASAGLLAIYPGLAYSAGNSGTKYKRIYLTEKSELPLKTAAELIAAASGAKIMNQLHSGTFEHGDLVLVTENKIIDYPKAIQLLPSNYLSIEWELIQRIGGGLLISGSKPRNICQAALLWLNNPVGETDRLSEFRFDERFTMWDNSMNQESRFSVGFNREKHIREIARMGHTGIEINRYADVGGYHVCHRKFPKDMYPWYMSYCPALDAFVESSLTKGIYPADELEANLKDLLEAAEISREYGLKPGFVTYEPRGVSEEVFDKYPELRGSRIDHPGRSLQPRYNMDVANPRVLEHYAELITNLMKAVPDLRYFVYWTNDSGSGLPFASKLYFGPNGSYLAKSKTLGQMNADFSRTILEAGRKINPEFEVIMNVGWEYPDEERLKLLEMLPKGVTFNHGIAGSLMKTDLEGNETFFKDDRAIGFEPYASIQLAAGFDPEPIIGLPTPTMLVKKLHLATKLNIRYLFTSGGTYSVPQCLYNINQKIYSEFIRNQNLDIEPFMWKTANFWSDGDMQSAKSLVQAWKTGDEAIENWPIMSWWNRGAAVTQGRWITRPLVPDITKLDKIENEAWERELFSSFFDIGKLNVVFHGSVRMFTENDFEESVKAYNEMVIPKLVLVISILDQAFLKSKKPALEDQRDRYNGILLRARTDCNIYNAQLAINYYLLKKGDPVFQKTRLRKAIEADMVNTSDWIRALSESKTNFFHIAEKEETPFMYKTPIEDLQLKLKVMRAHIDDEPGPYLKELAEDNQTFKN